MSTTRGNDHDQGPEELPPEVRRETGLGTGTVNPGSQNRSILVALGAALVIPLCLALGFLAGEQLLIGVGAVAGLGVLASLAFLRGSIVVHVCLVFLGFLLLQNLIGFVKVESFRGLSVGNVILLVLFAAWVYERSLRQEFYSPTSIDVPLILTVVVLPIASILVTVAFRETPTGYSLSTIAVWYKGWVTPYFCMFVLLQCVRERAQIRAFIVGLLTIVALCIAFSTARSIVATGELVQEAVDRGAYEVTGIISEPNIYAGFLNQVTPFLLLVIFLYPHRRILGLVSLGLLAAIAQNMLLTFSRGGYLGFALVVSAATYLGLRGNGRVPIAAPAALGVTVLVLTLTIAPQSVDYMVTRFEAADPNIRTSENRFGKANRLSGGRLELWSSAIRMWKEAPLFGVGFRSYVYRVAKYHRRGETNACHSLYLGTLAELGAVGLACLLYLVCKVQWLLYRGWKAAVRAQDRLGELVCGGGAISFLSMLWTGVTIDVHFGAGYVVLWATTAVCLRYAFILLREQASAEPASRTAAA